MIRLWKRYAAYWDNNPLTDEQQAQLGAFHGWVYESIFALAGGITADIEFGYLLADKYGRWVLRRKG